MFTVAQATVYKERAAVVSEASDAERRPPGTLDDATLYTILRTTAYSTAAGSTDYYHGYLERRCVLAKIGWDYG